MDNAPQINRSNQSKIDLSCLFTTSGDPARTREGRNLRVLSKAAREEPRGSSVPGSVPGWMKRKWEERMRLRMRE